VCVVVRGQEASCLRCEAVPIIGLKLPGVELATEKTDPSHCLSGKKKEFSVFLFSLVFIFMCVYLREGGGMRVTETIRYVSDCCQLNCDFESSRSALGCLPPFVSSSLLPVLPSAKCKNKRQERRSRT
jgi:hypothetical protein